MSDAETPDRPDTLHSSPYIDQLLELPVEQRDAWLRELESREPQIAADLGLLLAAQSTDRFATFLKEPIALAPPPAQYALPGELIGSYRILRELGQGGMAVVYLAQRADGHYSQQVALKILRFGPEGSQSQFHFAQERQILASLDDASIARLIDAGATATGLPYLVMEYVEGVPIDRYCDEKRLSVGARLRLFLKVADAVQYAHRHLIVHRDLKPSNIVVTNEGHVKLLDFGIAKLLAPGNFDHAAPPTRDGVWLMTPEFASPEQVLGDPITTATDIYQLGLLLYGLLTGREPYDLGGRRPIDAVRVICESEPLPPSACATTAEICAARATTPDRLRRALRRDLDAIVLKALRKEPEHRYASAGWLIDDIHRYQQGLTVGAYEGLWLYRAAKYFRRHARALAVAGIAVLAIALVTTWYTVQLADERNRAQREAKSAEQVAKFLTEVFRGSSSRVADGNTTARELLDHGARRIEKELADQTEIKARLMNVIGDVYVQYSLPDKAQPLLERALRENSRLFGADSKETADSLQALAKLARDGDDLQRARELFEKVLQIREHVLGPRAVPTADAVSELGFTFYRLGKTQEAIRALERAIDIYTASLGPNDERTLTAINALGLSVFEAGDLRRARTIYEQIVPRIERSLGPDHRVFASAFGNFASLKSALGDFDGLEHQFRRSLESFERLYGPTHGGVAHYQFQLAWALFNTGRLSESIAMQQRSITTLRRIGGPGTRAEGSALWGIGMALRTRGDLPEALQYFQRTVDLFRKALGESHSHYADTLQSYGETQLEMGHFAAAGQALSAAVAIMSRSRPTDNYETAAARVSHALLLARTGRAREAEKDVREALSIYEKVLPREHLLFVTARSVLGECLLEQGKPEQAEDFLVSSAKQLSHRLHYERRLALQRVIRLYQLKGMRDAARPFENEIAAFEQKVRAQ